MSDNQTHYIKPRNNKPGRTFTVTPDAYGVQLSDSTGATVVLDWNGTEVKATITDSTTDDPQIVATFDRKGKVSKVERLVVINGANEYSVDAINEPKKSGSNPIDIR